MRGLAMSLLGIEHHYKLHPGARTGGRLLGSILGVGLMAGCSVLQPYVEYPEGVSQGPQDAMAATRAQSENIDAIRERVAANRNETMITRNVLGLGVFGAIVGAGTTALYGGSADLVLGLGIGGATGYTAGQLYVPATKSQLYATAAGSLHCVSNAGFELDATASAAREQRKKLNDQADQLSKELSQCKDSDLLDESDAESARNALAAYTKADAQLDAVLAKDAEVADRLRQGSDRIVDALNAELGKNQPNLANVLNAASNVGPMGRAIVSSQPSVEEPKNSIFSQSSEVEAVENGCDQQTVRQIKSRTDIVATHSERIETKLRNALNPDNSASG